MDRFLDAVLPWDLCNLLVLDSIVLLLCYIVGNLFVLGSALLPVFSVAFLSRNILALLPLLVVAMLFGYKGGHRFLNIFAFFFWNRTTGLLVVNGTWIVLHTCLG